MRVVTVLSVIAILLALLVGALIHRRQWIGPSRYGFSTVADEIAKDGNFSGKVALVTGATSGLGWESARVLALRGVRVFVCGRSLEKAEKAIAKMKRSSPMGSSDGDLVPLECDLSSLQSVSACAARFSIENLQLDILMLNAGVAWVSEYSETPDGFETTMGVNHLSHFHLTNMLLPTLLASGSPQAPVRVVSVASSAHAMGSVSSMADEWLGMRAWGQRWWMVGAPSYGDSKLANIVHMQELQRRYGGQGVEAFSLNPGEILTSILKEADAWWPWLLGNAGRLVEPLLCKTAAQGAATQVYVALEAPTGTQHRFYEDCNPKQLSDPLYLSGIPSFVSDTKKTAAFWDASQRIVDNGLKKG